MAPGDFLGQIRGAGLGHLTGGQRTAGERNDQFEAARRPVRVKLSQLFYIECGLPLLQQILGGQIVQRTLLVDHMANGRRKDEEHSAVVVQLQLMLEMAQFFTFR